MEGTYSQVRKYEFEIRDTYHNITFVIFSDNILSKKEKISEIRYYLMKCGVFPESGIRINIITEKR
jgi:hypothetical protein